MANHLTGAQRYNNRADKIWEEARKNFAEQHALELLRRLENLVAVVNVEKLDPLQVFMAIEQARHVIEKAKGGR